MAKFSVLQYFQYTGQGASPIFNPDMISFQSILLLYHVIFMIFRYISSLRGHVNRVYQIAWSADSRLLCSGSSDSTLKVWNIEARKLHGDLPGHADEVGDQ